MRNEWDADTDTSPAVARMLLDSQFPEFSSAQMELLGAGWDNTAYLVDGRFVFRFPRRQSAAALILNEARILPELAPQLPIRIPVPILLGEPAGDYPYPFAGYEYLPGRTACSVNLDLGQREQLVNPVAEFLLALHSARLSAELPQDPVGKVDLPRRLTRILARLEQIAPVVGDRSHHLRETLEILAETPKAPEPDRPVHGDLYARHVLLDEQHRLCGIIDWGDVCMGSPELDLSVAISMLPPSAFTEFQRAFGAVSDILWARARFRALTYGVALTHFGHETKDPSILTAGMFAIKSGLDNVYP